MESGNELEKEKQGLLTMLIDSYIFNVVLHESSLHFVRLSIHTCYHGMLILTGSVYYESDLSYCVH